MRVTLLDLWGKEAMLHYISQLANHLAVCPNMEVTVLLPEGSDIQLFDSSIKIGFLDVIKDGSLKQRLFAPFKLMKLPWFFKAIHRTKPDILHINNCHVWYIFTLSWLKRFYPIISTLHDVEPHPGLDNTWRKRQEIAHLIHSSDIIFVHGETLRLKMLAKYPKTSPEQTYVIPLGEFSFFTKYQTHKEENPNVALFFGRIRDYKGLEYFLESAEMVVKEKSNARFVVAGDGDLRPYQHLIDGRKYLEIINHYIPDQQVAELFSSASMVVLPYTQASQSGVIPVAYAFSKPVITTRIDSLIEVVEDGRTGLIVPPHDPAALAGAMMRLFQNKELRAELGVNGYRKMQNELGWDKIATLTVNVYETAINDFEIKKRRSK